MRTKTLAARARPHHSYSRSTRRGLGDGFEDALRAGLNRMLALRSAAGDLAGADGHEVKVSLSFFIRYLPYPPVV
jgi:hypothetical protein